MMIQTDYNQVNTVEWDALVQSSPVASWFQTREAFLFFDSLSFMQAFVVSVSDEEKLKGVVVGYVQGDGGKIKRKLSSRAIINGGPLLANDITVAELSALLTATRTLLQHKVVYIETRNLNDYSKWRSTFEKCGFGYEPHYNFHIDMSDASAVDRRMDKSRRRRIRRAMENGVEVSCENPDIQGFYNILSNLYRTKIHKPLPPFNMFKQLGGMPFAKYFIVRNPQGETIGGQLTLMLSHRVAYAWYCCGLDKEYHDLYPSIVANYAAIRYAADHGFERYDMMGAGTPKEDYGVRDFKAQFGGTLVEHGRFLKVNKCMIYNIGRFYMYCLNKIKK